MTRRWHRILGDCLAVVGIALALIGMIGATAVQADAGTIKIHPSDSACALASNDPKPGEEFWVSGTGLGADSWTLWVVDGTNANDPVVIGPVAAGTSGEFCVGPFTLPAGHYKAFVGTGMAPADSMKTKVFKVTGEPPTTETTPTTVPPTTEPPTTEPPTTETTPTTVPPTTETTPTTVPPTTTAQVLPPGQVTTTAAPPTTAAGGLPSTGDAPMVSLILGLTLAAVGLTLRAVARRAA